MYLSNLFHITVVTEHSPLHYLMAKISYTIVNKMAGLQALPIDIHIMIAKLLNLNECLIYSQVSRVTFDAAYYVFAHRKQLDFGVGARSR